MVLARELVESQGLLDGFLDPSDQLRIASSPFGDPCGEVLVGLLDRAAVVEPAQFLQAVVVGLSGQMVEGVAKEVDVAALKGGFGKFTRTTVLFRSERRQSAVCLRLNINTAAWQTNMTGPER